MLLHLGRAWLEPALGMAGSRDLNDVTRNCSLYLLVPRLLVLASFPSRFSYVYFLNIGLLGSANKNIGHSGHISTSDKQQIINKFFSLYSMQYLGYAYALKLLVHLWWGILHFIWQPYSHETGKMAASTPRLLLH